MRDVDYNDSDGRRRVGRELEPDSLDMENGEIAMIGDTAAKFDDLSLPEAELIDASCDMFETAWRTGGRPCIDNYLDAIPEPCRTILLLELIKRELELRAQAGERPGAEEYRVRFPDQSKAIDEIFQAARQAEKGISSWPDADRQPNGKHPVSSIADAPTIDMEPAQLTDPSQFDRAIGRQLGDYLILERLGSGGMGVVYRALQRSANRFVALKLIKADWWGDSTHVSSYEAEIRFRNEAQAHAQLDHDHIVPVYDVGHVGSLLFFSMRLIKGRSLGQIVLSDGPLTPRRAAYYIEAIARAIQYAHDHHVLHRDVKPNNILVDENNRPFLIDLGLAKSLEATDYSTLSGKVIGTAEYMSPEQAQGHDEISFATDVYGLGATLFALLTGRPPFTGPNPVAVLRQVIDDEPVWPRERNKPVGPELKAICLKCLEKDPSQRIASAGELADELGKYLRYERCKYTLPGPWTRLIKWARRQPWRAVAAGLAIVAVLVAASAWAMTASRDRATSEVLLNDLQTIPMAELPRKIQQMAGYRGWVNPRLHAMLSNDPEPRTRILLALLPSEPRRATELADRLLTCGPEEHRVIREALRDRWKDFIPRLRKVLDGPRSADPARRSRAAAALIALDRPEIPETRAWAELRLEPDPGPRVELIDWLVRSKVDPEVLIAHLETEHDPSIRRGVIQVLADVGVELPADATLTYLPRLVELYRHDADSGVHSSVAYLLRRWGRGEQAMGIDAELTGKPRGAKRWYVNSQGQTMIVIGRDDDLDSSQPLPRRLSYRLAVAATETTLGEYQQSDPDYLSRRRRYPLREESNLDAPADIISYDDAARYCNWLSKKEGISSDQWCYDPGDPRQAVALVPDYLSRRGYRLPNIEEWEYAARAGTITDRYFGQSLEHASAYAWHIQNSKRRPKPVGLKRPNDFGLFDVLGNMQEWCYNPDPPHSAHCSCQATRGRDCQTTRLVSMRGGSFYQAEPALISRPPVDAGLDILASHSNLHFHGFRIVKLEL
jgi:eukaryotic-like serine/threonine-protein kinase